MLWIIYLVFCIVPINSQYSNSSGTAQNVVSMPCTDESHLVLVPGVLSAGGTNRACISRFYTRGPAKLLLALLSEDRQTTTASRDLPAGDGGCLDFNVPQLPNTKAEFLVSVRYEGVCVWEKRMTVRISSGKVVVVHTERARYRPGDTLRVRILALKADLTPPHGLIDDIWLEGPKGAWEGTRIAQWQRIHTRLGLAQIQYQIDELAPPGRWTVRAKLGDGSQGSASFRVGNYELPPFQLSVRHAPKVLRRSDRLVWTVCVRYPWSEAVEGMLVIRLRGAGGSFGSSSAGVRTAVQLRSPKACHRHAAAARRVGLNGDNPPDVVVADFSFQEEGTRVWQNTTVVSQVVDEPISLEFLTKHRAVISPGLPYKLKVKAMRFDDKPASNERIRVCRYPASQMADPAPELRDQICAEGIADNAGVAVLLFSAGNDAAPFYRFEASLSNDTSITAIPLTLPVRRSSSLHAALGPLKADSKATRTFVPLYLNVANISTSITVHFVVITRGGTIYRWGATTQCPVGNSAEQIHTSARNSRCKTNSDYYDRYRNVVAAQHDYNNANIDYNSAKTDFNSAKNDYLAKRYYFAKYGGGSIGRNDIMMAQTSAKNESDPIDMNASDSLLNRHLLRVMLPIKISNQMCPDSHLIAYFYYNGEFVSASKHFEMDECFATKVETSWVSRQVLPGAMASLQVSTPGPALCALTVLDSAAKWTQPAPAVKETLMTGLRRLVDGHRNLTEYDAAGDCFLNMESLETPSSSIELTATWLAVAGVRLLGGDLPPKRHCDPQPAALLADETITPRNDFSEAWLWRLLAVGVNGTAIASARAPDSITRFEAGAVCLSRNGVAVSQPAVLQVFREFFIHADSPKRLRRGDTAIIRYRIFNYLYEPLSVQIQILTDPDMEGPTDPVESVCIKARSSVARRIEVRPMIAAPSRVSIRAKAVTDGNCGNVTSARTGVSDEVTIRMTVEPEGVPIREQKSIILCGDRSESSTSEVTWTWSPVQAVHGTETLTLWAVGDDIGPLLADADSLVLIPRGCGEQNMAQLALNLMALNLLDPSTPAADIAREHVARGYTRQLQYVHPSGGFSAFGPSDATSSTWLTAFTVKHLRKAHKILWPNLPVPPSIIRAERWLLSQQMENGCFRNEGQVFHRELKGGLNEDGEIASVALTAYVITSLVESTSPIPFRAVRNTLACLRALPPLKSMTPTRIYGQALLAYAYIRLEKYEEDLRKTNEANFMKRNIETGLEKDEGARLVKELVKMATRNGDYVWWEASSVSSSVEATAYALLGLQASPAVLRDSAPLADAAAGARRWLGAQRGPSGGFVSTQDTLVALEALTAWSTLHPPRWTNLTVSARSSGLDASVTLQPGAKIPDILKMRPGEKLNVAVRGLGCALVQATRAYNTLESSGSQEKQLSVQVAVHTDGPFDCDANSTVCYCAAVIETCVMWSGPFPQMALLEVSLPGGYGADAALLYSQLHKSSSLLRRIELTPSNTRATFYLGTRDGADTVNRAGHQCYYTHAVGPRTKVKPAYARVQDYYRPSVNDTQTYTIPEECPPRIAHDTNQYHSSDNLFDKARSLDSGEILISDEISFEDIPEGIPLEDPMYENLTKRNKTQEVDKVNFKNQGLKVNNSAYIENKTDEGVLKYQLGLTTNGVKNNEMKIVEVGNKSTLLKKETDALAINGEKVNESTINLGNTQTLNENSNKHLNSKPSAVTVNDIVKLSHVYTNHKVDTTKIPLQDNLINHMNEFTLINKNHTNNFAKNNVESRKDNNSNIHSVIKAPPNLASKPFADYKIEVNKHIDNPNLSSFHVIDMDGDLDTPSGIEGPVPTIVLPPPNFRPPPIHTNGHTRTIPRMPPYETPQGPYLYSKSHVNTLNRRYYVPVVRL